MGLRLQNMRDRKKDKGVKICPNVTINDSDFIEPPVKRDEEMIETSGGIEGAEEPLDVIREGSQEEDDEGIADPEIERKHDEENMRCVEEKINKGKASLINA